MAHDTAIAAAGMARYGLHDEAETLNGAVFDAAAAFEDDRLPELFCEFDRSDEGPVPYREANAPQAWAASAAILNVQTMLGLVPDAPNGRCALRPRLPERVPRLDVHGIRVGNGTFDVETERSGARTDVVRIDAERVNVVQGSPTAPLWGSPPP